MLFAIQVNSCRPFGGHLWISFSKGFFVTEGKLERLNSLFVV